MQQCRKAVYAVNDNFSSGTVIPIRTATNTRRKAIKVGKGPYAIAIMP
jgi:YVTN family beta-propeller protein